MAFVSWRVGGILCFLVVFASLFFLESSVLLPGLFNESQGRNQTVVGQVEQELASFWGQLEEVIHDERRELELTEVKMAEQHSEIELLQRQIGELQWKINDAWKNVKFLEERVEFNENSVKRMGTLVGLASCSSTLFDTGSLKFCGKRKLLEDYGVGVVFANHHSSTHLVTGVEVSVALSLCYHKRKHDQTIGSRIEFFAALVGPEIIPLHFHFNQTSELFVAKFVPAVAGEYLLDVSLMLVNREGDDAWSWFEGKNTPVADYLNGHGSGARLELDDRTRAECIEESRIYGSLSVLEVRGDSAWIPRDLCKNPDVLTTGHWRSSLLPNTIIPPIFDDLDGNNFHWYWQPVGCNLDFDLQRLKQCLANKASILLIGDWEMAQLGEAMKLMTEGVSAEYVAWDDTHDIDSFQSVVGNALKDKSYTHVVTNLGLKAQLAGQKNYLDNSAALLEALHALPVPQNKTFVIPPLTFGGNRDFGFIPARTKKLNEFVQSEVAKTNGTWRWFSIDRLSEGRWEASIDGASYWGPCKNEMDVVRQNAITRRDQHRLEAIAKTEGAMCGGVMKAVALVMINQLCYGE